MIDNWLAIRSCVIYVLVKCREMNQDFIFRAVSLAYLYDG
jgi:hypothetical protein